MPESYIFQRRLAHPHPIADRGEGIYLWDNKGRRYIDGSSGAAVANIGHGRAEIAQAIAEQAAKVAYVHGTVFSTDVLENYSARLAALTPVANPRFYYLSSGSEAIETALKFARQVSLARGEATREVVISRWGSYHGATLGALSVTGKPRMRTPFAPLFRDHPHIPPPFCYRCPFGETYPSCDLACAQALETEILHQGPDRVMAFIAESVGGATLGAVVPPEDYWLRIAQICDRHRVFLIVDEVMAGLGRTGRWFGIQHFDVEPDIITMGKGVTAGYFPLSITAVQDSDIQAVLDAHGDFAHGSTYSHHAVGAAAAQATLDYLEQHDLVTAAAHLGSYLSGKMETDLGELPCVGDIRGLGLLWGIEFVVDRETKEPISPEIQFNRRVGDRAFERGVIFYPGAGCVDGVRGDHLLITPPLIITKAEIDEMVGLLREVILEVWEQIS
jgi:adenosylmethionine-8-amino-7-oxononanoate aminotransferase